MATTKKKLTKDDIKYLQSNTFYKKRVSKPNTTKKTTTTKGKNPKLGNNKVNRMR